MWRQDDRRNSQLAGVAQLVTMKATTPEVESPPQAATTVEKGEEESCRSCLYTGVATCTFLSAYFLHLALEEQPSKQKPTDATIRKYRSNDKNIPRSSTHTQKQPIDLFERSIKLMQQKSPPKSNRRFHLAFSAAWAIAGMYRLYLN